MENVERRYVDVFGADTLTWAEYNLEYFAKAILERATSIVQPKKVVSDFDKAAWFTSLTVLLGKMLPPNRFLFRIMEEESRFLIQFHDTAQIQQPQTIEVPYRKVFKWEIETWEDALRLCKEDRHKFYEKWRSEGLTHGQISDHFGCKNSGNITTWLNSDSKEASTKLKHDRFATSSQSAIAKRVWCILDKEGIRFIQHDALENAFYQITGVKACAAIYLSKRVGATISPDILKCLNIAIRYVEEIIEKIKEVNALTYSNTSLRPFFITLARSTGIKCNKVIKWIPTTGQTRHLINHESLEKYLKFYNNVLTNLNKMKGELK